MIMYDVFARWRRCAMNDFIEKKIVTQRTIGETLKNIREGLGYSLEEMAQRTSIRSFYLEAIERGAYDEIPGEVYIKSFLKVYSEVLGLRAKDIMDQYGHERVVWEGFMKNRPRSHKEKWAKRFVLFVSNPQTIRYAVIGSIVGVVMAYIGYQLYAIVLPPELIIESPDDSIVVSERVVRVIGKTAPSARVTMNGEPVLLSDDGSFLEDVDMVEGVNIIRIEAGYKYSRKNVVERHVFIEESERPLIEKIE